MKNSVLVVKLGAIGDVVMALPMLDAIEKAHPDWRIDWIVGHVAAPVLECVESTSLRIIKADEKALFRGGLLERVFSLMSIWRKLGIRRYERIFILNGDWRYGAIPLWCLGKRVWLAATRGERTTIPGRHASSEYVRMTAGIDANSAFPRYPRLALPVLPAEIEERLRGMPAGIVAISPGGAKNVMREEGLRRWPVERYLELVHALRSAGHPLMLIGGPGEEWVSERFGEFVDLDLVGKLSLPETMAALKKASVLVTHDSGPIHLGDAVGVPIVGLFGPTMPSEKAPIQSRHAIHWGGGTLGCRPCYDGRRYALCGRNSCLADIPLGAVLDSIGKVLHKAEG